MSKYLLATVCIALSACISTGCKDDVPDQIIGKYEHADLPGQTFEFGTNNRYVETMKAGTADCTIEYRGTWAVEGDSLFVDNYKEPPVCHFGDSVPPNQKEIIRKLAEGNRHSRLSFKIVGVDSVALSLEREGKITTYSRIGE